VKLALLLACVIFRSSAASAADAQPTAADLQQQLATLSIDPDQAYRVRDLRLRRGDVSIFFNEGTLILARPIAGHRIAAVFTATGTEGGDGEILVLSAQAAERTSLASFTGGPNLDEHFRMAFLLFSDTTLDEIRSQLDAQPLRSAPEVAEQVAAQVNPVLQSQGGEIRTAMLASLLDAHQAADGPFFATIVGRQLGPFDLLYYPDSFEPLTIGRVDASTSGQARFRVWTGYRPLRAAPYIAPAPSIRDYRLDVTIGADLAMTAIAQFHYRAETKNGRVISLMLSPRLRVESGSINGVPAEVEQHPSDFGPGDPDDDATILLVASDALVSGDTYNVQLHYSGSVIRHVSGDSYFVGDRAIWYPRTVPMLTNFDLFFRFPDRFRLASTGELVEEEKLAGHLRTVHRRTTVPEQLAGFNLGQYALLNLDSGPYHVECYADSSASEGMNGIPGAAAGILAYYTRQWVPLPIHSLAVTPIPGYFGQGFPGLIYLSSVSYVRERDRPPQLRDARSSIFFSSLLLPHEIAHQWWGNMVTSANYRSNWLMEAMANYSALQFVKEREGGDTASQILLRFRDDLLSTRDARQVESSGPLDFGGRLLDAAGEYAWHVIVYEKGAWVLHMLHERLGADQFRALQQYILRQYSGRPITNDDFRDAASRFVPQGQPDTSLKKFFETWVYGTGVPKLRLARGGKDLAVMVSEVDDEFTADLPLRCKFRDGKEETRWVPIVLGENPLGRTGAASCELPLPTEFLSRP
jgi:hypothetical protein